MRTIAFVGGLFLLISALFVGGVQIYMGMYSLKLMEQAGWHDALDDDEVAEPETVASGREMAFVERDGREAPKYLQKLYTVAGLEKMPRRLSMHTFVRPEELLLENEKMPAADMVALMVQARTGRVVEANCKVSLEQLATKCKASKYSVSSVDDTEEQLFRVAAFMQYEPARPADPLPDQDRIVILGETVTMDPIFLTGTGTKQSADVQRQVLSNAESLCDEVRATYGNCTLNEIKMDLRNSTRDELGPRMHSNIGFAWFEAEPKVQATGPLWKALPRKVKLREEGSSREIRLAKKVFYDPGRLEAGRKVDVSYILRLRDLFTAGEKIPDEGAYRDFVIELRARQFLAEKCATLTEDFAQACDVEPRIKMRKLDMEGLAMPDNYALRINGSLRFVPRQPTGEIPQDSNLTLTTETVKLPEQKLASHFGNEIDRRVASVVSRAERHCAELRQTWGNCEVVKVDAGLNNKRFPDFKPSYMVAYIKSDSS